MKRIVKIVDVPVKDIIDAAGRAENLENGKARRPTRQGSAGRSTKVLA
ncbi:hypothetical protein [Bradyrhizobium sp. CCBAU 51753]|nr:hypothetical protein [Bradyrhizobium sp. CCBAU 51753]